MILCENLQNKGHNENNFNWNFKNHFGNEIAYSVAKQACSKNASLPGVTYISICARIRHMIKEPHIQHERTAEVYSAYSCSRECQIRSRSDQTTDKTPYWKVQMTARLQKPLRWIWPHMPPLQIRSRKIFNTGCRDAKRQKTEI